MLSLPTLNANTVAEVPPVTGTHPPLLQSDAYSAHRVKGDSLEKRFVVHSQPLVVLKYLWVHFDCQLSSPPP